jgi:hypothetical protein
VNFPDGSAREVTNGFVGIETAELLRQKATVSKFQADHPGEYRALVEATIALKRAHQTIEEAKAAARSVPAGVPLSDILDEAERDARAILKQPPEAPTAKQVLQVGDEANAPSAAPAEPPPGWQEEQAAQKKKAKAS